MHSVLPSCKCFLCHEVSQIATFTLLYCSFHLSILLGLTHLAFIMISKSLMVAETDHVEDNSRALELEDAHARSHITKDIPVQEVLQHHLDEDPKRVARIRRKVDVRLTLTLAVLYTFAFIDRANLGNVSQNAISRSRL